ncbi:MAG: hypothetical protein ACLGI2_05795 [Acidimicrobiia bacterium]
MSEDSELTSAVAELDDEYLKVLLLLSVRRAHNDEPRRAGFWHALATSLAEEQERRRSAAELTPGAVATSVAADEGPEVEAVLEELRHEMASLEAEMRESRGDLRVAGSE